MRWRSCGVRVVPDEPKDVGSDPIDDSGDIRLEDVQGTLVDDRGRTQPIILQAAPAERPKGLLQRTAEIFVVVTALGFLASAVVNTLIFMHWNVWFLAVATSADVLMSGVQLLLFSGFTWLYAIGLAWLLIPKPGEPRFNRARSIFTNVCFLATVIGFFYQVYLAFAHDGRQLGAERYRNSGALIFSLILLSRIISIAGDPMTSARSFRDNLKSGLGGSPIALGAILVIASATMIGGQLALSGFAESVWYDKPGDPNCMPLRVIWLGQSSLLAQCPSTGEVRVINRTPDGVVIRVSDARPTPLRTPVEPTKAK